jgi:hypothetical protein
VDQKGWDANGLGTPLCQDRVRQGFTLKRCL